MNCSKWDKWERSVSIWENEEGEGTGQGVPLIIKKFSWGFRCEEFELFIYLSALFSWREIIIYYFQPVCKFLSTTLTFWHFSVFCAIIYANILMKIKNLPLLFGNKTKQVLRNKIIEWFKIVSVYGTILYICHHWRDRPARLDRPESSIIG